MGPTDFGCKHEFQPTISVASRDLGLSRFQRTDFVGPDDFQAHGFPVGPTISNGFRWGLRDFRKLTRFRQLAHLISPCKSRRFPGGAHGFWWAHGFGKCMDLWGPARFPGNVISGKPTRSNTDFPSFIVIWPTDRAR